MMKRKMIKWTITLLLFSFPISIQAQRFDNEVDILLKQKMPNHPHPILFIGSSSFTRWKDVQQYFPGCTILNRGFGGSTLSDQIEFADRIIFSVKPRQIVIYCGENDLAEDSLINGKTVFHRFKKLYRLIRQHSKDVPVIYVSMKPSPSRMNLIPQMTKGNRLIKRMSAFRIGLNYAKVDQQMLLPSGLPDPSLFVEDELHMNEKGYSIWQNTLTPLLINDLSCTKP